jgi:hypothetical protein
MLSANSGVGGWRGPKISSSSVSNSNEYEPAEGLAPDRLGIAQLALKTPNAVEGIVVGRAEVAEGTHAKWKISLSPFREAGIP